MILCFLRKSAQILDGAGSLTINGYLPILGRAERYQHRTRDPNLSLGKIPSMERSEIWFPLGRGSRFRLRRLYNSVHRCPASAIFPIFPIIHLLPVCTLFLQMWNFLKYLKLIWKFEFSCFVLTLLGTRKPMNCWIIWFAVAKIVRVNHYNSNLPFLEQEYDVCSTESALTISNIGTYCGGYANVIDVRSGPPHVAFFFSIMWLTKIGAAV